MRFCVVALALVLGVASSGYAGPRPRAASPPPKPKEDTIISVNAGSITVQHTKIEYPTKPREKAKAVVSTQTYKINDWTEVLLNGGISDATMLKPGMTVDVQAESASGLPDGAGVSASTEMVATEIIAHTAGATR